MKKLAFLVTFCLGCQFLFAQPSFSVSSDSIINGDSTLLNITTRDFTDLTKVEFSINWNPQVIELQRLEIPNTSLNLIMSNFDLSDSGNGNLAFSWLDLAGLGITLSDHTILFKISYKAKGNSLSQSSIDFTGTPLPININRNASGDANIGMYSSTSGVIQILDNQVKLDVDGDAIINGRLNLLGQIRISDIPNGTGDILMVDANGYIVHAGSTVKASNRNTDNSLIQEQRKEIEKLRLEVKELKSIVKQFINNMNSEEELKNKSYILSLEKESRLSQNQPNPFNQNTIIEYLIPNNTQSANLKITTLGGEMISNLNIQETGKGQVIIQSRNYPSGTYFYSLIIDGQLVETRKMILTR